MTHTPNISREDRDKLFARMRDETLTDAQRKTARDDLIVACLPIVDNVTRRFRGYGDLDHEDIYQIGCVALIGAIDAAHTSYWAYATRRVAGDVASAVSKATLQPSIGKDTLRRARKVRETVYRHTETVTFTDAIDAAARDHDITREQVIDALIVTANPVSLDAPTVTGDPKGTRIADPDPTPEDTAIHADETSRVLALLHTLPMVERVTISRQIGLHPGSTKPSDIARDLGVNVSVVSRAQRVGWARLRHPCRTAGLTV